MANETTPKQLPARIADLEGRPAKGGSVSFKVSEKGAVSVYGLGRFPVTLYLEQWEVLLSHANELREFIEAPIVEAEDQGSDQALKAGRPYRSANCFRRSSLVLQGR
jgi:hypothetical protein